VWRRCTLGVVASAICALLLIAQATAQIPPPLTVTRGPGAESCPDLERLARQVARLRRGEQASGASAYAVTFSRTPAGFEASIRSSGGSARVLEDHGPDCSALEQATAITLALLRDSDQGSLPSEEPGANPPPKPARVTKRSAKPAARVNEVPKRSRPGLNWILSAGGAGLVGIVRPIAPALGVEAGASVGRVRAHLGALGMLPQRLSLGPGTVHESLLSGVARGCVTAARGSSLRFDLCSGAYVGRFETEARGYTRNRSASKMWLTIPIELALVHSVRHYWGELGVSALIPLQSAEFAIDGLGRAYDSPPIGALISLRLGYATGL